MSNGLDSLILSSANDRWQKVAKVMALVSERHHNTDFGAIETRIRTLVDGGKLEAKGNLSQWRFSEIRRAQSR